MACSAYSILWGATIKHIRLKRPVFSTIRVSLIDILRGMRTLSQDDFSAALTGVDMQSRLKNELKFHKSVEALPGDWSDYELIAITDRTGRKGILLLQPDNDLYIVQYELSRSVIDSQTGRGRPIICDFCYTWQPGSNAASILFTKPHSKLKVGFLCCGDLGCSQHVRSTTKEGMVSRTQLRENLTNQQRVDRLKSRLRAKIQQLELTATTESE